METIRTTTSRARLLTAGLALALLTTGCATSADDRTDVGTENRLARTAPTERQSTKTARSGTAPTETTRSSPTQAEATRPEMPAAARNVDAAGARAAARYFLELEHYAVVTGDLDEWKQVSLPECEYCTETTTRVEAMKAAGQRSGGADVSVEGSALPVEADGTYLTRMLVSVSAGARYDADGAVVAETPAFTVLVDLDVKQLGGTWRIVDGTLYTVPMAVPRANHPDRAV